MSWQLEHGSDLLLTAKGMAKVFGEQYDYTPGKKYRSYNLEQQAKIVQDWFGRHYTPNSAANDYGLAAPRRPTTSPTTCGATSATTSAPAAARRCEEGDRHVCTDPPRRRLAARHGRTRVRRSRRPPCSPPGEPQPATRTAWMR